MGALLFSDEALFLFLFRALLPQFFSLCCFTCFGGVGAHL